MTLVEFLLDRIAEDERGAEVLRQRDEASGITSEWLGFLPGRGSFAARVLAECEAKRAVIELHTPVAPEPCHCGVPWSRHEGPRPRTLCGECVASDGRYCNTMYLLALPYADHPDYREEWKP